MLEKETTKFTKDIKNLIDANYNTYQHISRITADFRTEKGTTKSYNGRQVLEMLQNADDAKTDIVSINLDRENNVLSISNNGNPFTVEEGIASLMLAGTSSKKKEFIGNKGLGFRSILNWVSEVRIITREEVVVFSEKTAKEEFEKLDIDAQKELIVNNQDRLRDNEVPFAILAIPRVYPNHEVSLFETTVELTYKEEVDGEKIIEKIEEQLNLLAPEILLFLNHTNSINIVDSSSSLTKNIIRTTNEVLYRISINESTWNIEDSGEVHYKTVNDKEQYFNYKIAWQDDLSDINSKFFTHFPTQEYTHLPFLIHATFDLDPSRNYLNQSQENVDLLNEISNKIGEIAENNIRKEIADWNAYKFLSPERISEKNQLEKFHQDLEELRIILEIYPCADGNYRYLDDVVFFGNEFSDFIITNNLQGHFENLMLPIPENIVLEALDYYTKTLGNISDDNFIEIIKNISIDITNNKVRAELIYLLSTEYFKKYHSKNYPLLTNKNDIIILEEFTVFTPSFSEEIDTPTFVNIDIINRELYDNLISLFKDAFNTNEPKSRELQRIIKVIVNIQPYDISNITKQIISGTREKLKEAEPSEINTIIKEMVFVLNYNRYINPEQEPPKELIPLINKNEKTVNNRDLFLGSDYPTGELTSDIFEGVYSNNDYLINANFWGFENDKITEDFFLWLGVNKYGKFEKISKSFDRLEEDGFVEYVFKNTQRPENNSYKEYNVTSIANFDKIISNSNFSLEKLVVWILKDHFISSQLEDENSDEFNYTYSGKRRDVSVKPSFIKYQIISKKLFNNIIVDNSLSELLTNEFDFNHEFFKIYNIEENQIKSLLIKLGAKQSFYDTEPEFAYQLLNEITVNEKFKDGKGSQQIYKKILDYFVKNKDSKLNDFEFNFNGLQYFARLGGKGKDYELLPFDEVYYSDNSLLPANIIKDYWILNLPKRIGEDNVKTFFGVKLIQDELKSLKVINQSISTLNEKFILYINKLKPYFLTYRFNTSMDEEMKRKEANAIKKLNICLVKEISYKFNIDEVKFLEENGFLEIDSIFYIKSSITKDINVLRNDPVFCDSIAEVLSIAFKVTDLKNSFRTVFKDSIEESKHLIKVDELSFEYSEAIRFLGISIEEIDFWTIVFSSVGKVLPKLISTNEELESIIKQNIGYNLPSFYSLVNFHSFKDENSIEFLKHVNGKFGINIKELLGVNSNGLINYHSKKIINKLHDLKKHFNHSLWHTFNKERAKQSLLISQQTNYDNLLDEIDLENKKFEVIEDYENFLKPIIEQTFGFKLTEKIKNEIKIIDSYHKIFKAFNIDENDIDDENDRSLLYFENNEKTVNAFVKEISNFEDEKDEEVNKNIQTGTLHFDASTSKLLNQNKTKKGSRKKATVGNKQGRRNKRAGKKAELLVYNTLMKDDAVGEVQWVSGYSNTSDKSDKEHYDMRYKLNGKDIWKYLEVKAFNGQYFHLSIAEKDKAFEESENFEIGLVDGEDIFILKDLFTDETNFETNNKFSATPADYIITLKVN